MSRYTYLIDILLSTGSISDFNQIKCSKDKCGSFVQVQDFCNKYHLDIEKQMFVPVCLQFLLRWWTVDTGQQTWCSTGHRKH